MKTLILDLSSLEKEITRELLGFTLTLGLNFRKINKIENEQLKDVLFIELLTAREEKTIKEFLTENRIINFLVIGKNNSVKDNGKTLGVFRSTQKTNNVFLDKSTGKKFEIVKG
jgi:hypothetical protein